MRAWWLACLLLCVTQSVHAQDVQQQAEGRARFEEAMELMRKRSFERACELFEQSFALAADMTTAFRMAECFEQIGKMGAAWHYYSEVAEAAAGAGMDERRDYAKKRAEALAPKLGRLRVNVPDNVASIDDLLVTIDERNLSRSLWNHELRVDPGEHEISASAPEHEPWSQTVDIENATDDAAVTLALRRRPPPPVDEPESESLWVPPSWIGIALTSVGAAGVVTGLVVGGIAKSNHDESLDFCVERACRDEGLALQDEAIAQGEAATVVFTIGAIALATGAGFWLASAFAGGEADETKPAADVGVGLGHINVRFRH
jgi:hypothetical protein